MDPAGRIETRERSVRIEGAAQIGQGHSRAAASRRPADLCETKRQVGLLRMLQAGVIVSDYATLIVEVQGDNARPEAGAVYGAMDMPWAKLVGQIARAKMIPRARDNQLLMSFPLVFVGLSRTPGPFSRLRIGTSNLTPGTA
jgi:hypothetical protein